MTDSIADRLATLRTTDDLDASAAMVLANEVVDLVLAELPLVPGGNPADAAALAKHAAEALREAATYFSDGEQQVVLLAANYWETRAAESEVEGFLMQDRTNYLFRPPTPMGGDAGAQPLSPEEKLRREPEKTAEPAQAIDKLGDGARLEERAAKTAAQRGPKSLAQSSAPLPEPTSGKRRPTKERPLRTVEPPSAPEKSSQLRGRPGEVNNE